MEEYRDRIAFKSHMKRELNFEKTTKRSLLAATLLFGALIIALWSVSLDVIGGEAFSKGAQSVVFERAHADFSGSGGDGGYSEGGGTGGAGGNGAGGGGFGCFIAGTQVVLGNGSSVDIQKVKVGDVLLGAGGAKNEVLRVINVSLGNRSLYSINGGRFFVSEEHPFMTSEGWKSINPEKNSSTSPVRGRLAVGDTLVTKEGGETIFSIEKQSDSPSTKLYNFSLGGNHTYFADGYLVHNIK